MIRTTIVATMGPACSDPELLYRMFAGGVDVCRLNFSHGELDSHLEMLHKIREAAARWEHPIAILGDLGGPKIRLGHIDDVQGCGGMPVKVGDELIVQRDPASGNHGRVSTNYPGFVEDVQVGDRVLVEDGLLRFICTDKRDNEVHCSCTAGGVLKTAKGINLPHTRVNLPSITDRDWQCTEWAVANDLDYLALSFVRKAHDLHTLREFLQGKQSAMGIIAKIEKSEALQEIDAIIDASDGLMIARGDLGVEMDVAQVPIIQKDLVKRCQTAGKPVIVATQMLQSMIEQSSPTRAEVSDVANAIFEGADAVMLSGETSIGKFPVGAVHMMSHIADVTEQYLNTQTQRQQPALKMKHLSVAVAKGVWQIVQELKVDLVVIWSQTGMTARIFSKNHFPMPVVALSSDRAALRRMALHFGVIPQEMGPPSDVATLVRQVDDLVRNRSFAPVGSRIIIVARSSQGMPGAFDGIILHTVGERADEHSGHQRSAGLEVELQGT